jgi:hypothetical protein
MLNCNGHHKLPQSVASRQIAWCWVCGQCRAINAVPAFNGMELMGDDYNFTWGLKVRCGRCGLGSDDPTIQRLFMP